MWKEDLAIAVRSSKSIAVRSAPTDRAAVVRTTMDPGILATDPNGRVPDIRSFPPERPLGRRDPNCGLDRFALAAR
jgi:hypothetical protein